MGGGLAIQLFPIFQPEKPAVAKIVLTPTPTDVPSATPTITPTAGPTYVLPTKPHLATIKIAAIDYSKARPNGIVTDAKIRLYKESGELIGEKTPVAYVTNGPVGSGGDATFEVPLGTYRAEAEAGNMKGTLTIKVTDYELQAPAVYMGAKSIRISGRYFIDSNGNTQYDEGEQMLPGKKVSAVVDTEGTLYTAAETTTDEKGYYNLYATINGKYSMTGEAGAGYNPQSSGWANLSGGESINYDIYARPQ